MGDLLSSILDTIGNIISPIMVGVILTLILAPVYMALCRKMKKIWASLICLLIVFVAVAALSLLIIPQTISSIGSFINQMPSYIEAFDNMTDNLFANNPDMAALLEESYSGINSSISTWITGQIIPNLSKYATSIGSSIWSVVNGFKNFIIGIIIMVYLLNMMDKLNAQGKKIVYSRMSIEKANNLVSDMRYTAEVFSAFFSGKIFDSIIIGILTFIIVSIFQMPYSVLIAVVVGVTNIIPFFGPFIGAIPCAFLLLLVSPVKCLEFVIIIIIIQQLDGNVIGPKILGDATGVPSFWVLISILVFGGLFGIVGMLLAVPAFAVIFRICKRGVYERLEKKKMSTNTDDYTMLEKVDEETGEFVTYEQDPGSTANPNSTLNKIKNKFKGRNK